MSLQAAYQPGGNCQSATARFIVYTVRHRQQSPRRNRPIDGRVLFRENRLVPALNPSRPSSMSNPVRLMPAYQTKPGSKNAINQTQLGST